MPAPRTLRQSFYAGPTLTVAEALLGKVLVHRTPAGTASGRIVEVEAYIGEDDPACHAAPGPTARNEPLYGPPGIAYVYLNYGMHYLVNAVTEPAGSPAAVLLRALEPLEGLDLMRRRRALGGRQAPSDDDLCRGPGNLTRALGITLAQNRMRLYDSELLIQDRGEVPKAIVWTTRIGLTVGVDHQWRAYVVGSTAVSGRRTKNVERGT